MKSFYRVGSLTVKQGLWYDPNGNFTGHIHGKFDFCLNHTLRMDYDPEIVGYLSATDSLDALFMWFPKNDILRLQQNDYFIYRYLATDWKWYARFNHWVINQETSVPVERILL